MPNILFRADANIKSGIGDLLSLVYLSEYFNGWKKYFITKDNSVARAILEKHKIRHPYFLSSDISNYAEVTEVNKFIKKHRIHIIFLEITNGRLNSYDKLRAPFKAYVDFYGKVPKGADLVINWDVDSEKLYDINKRQDTLFLLGPRYVILKKTIINEANKLRKLGIKNKKIKNILISFGGFDEFNFTLQVAKCLEGLGMNFNIRIILGAGYLYKKEILDFIRKSKACRYLLYQNVVNMQIQYRQADLFIGSGGLSLFEAITLRLPAAIIATYKHQIKRCEYFHSKRIIRYLGFRRFDENQLKSLIVKNDLRHYKDRVQSLSIPRIIDERLNDKI